MTQPELGPYVTDYEVGGWYRFRELFIFVEINGCQLGRWVLNLEGIMSWHLSGFCALCVLVVVGVFKRCKCHP